MKQTTEAKSSCNTYVCVRGRQASSLQWYELVMTARVHNLTLGFVHLHKLFLPW